MLRIVKHGCQHIREPAEPFCGLSSCAIGLRQPGQNMGLAQVVPSGQPCVEPLAQLRNALLGHSLLYQSPAAPDHASFRPVGKPLCPREHHFCFSHLLDDLNFPTTLMEHASKM